MSTGLLRRQVRACEGAAEDMRSGQSLPASSGSPWLRLRAHALYKSACGSETMTRRELGGTNPLRTRVSHVSTCANSGQCRKPIGLAAHRYQLPARRQDSSSGSELQLRAGRGAARHRAERRRQDEPVAADRGAPCRSPPGSFALRAATPCRLPELCHYVGHANAVKTRAQRRRESCLLGRFPRRRRSPISTTRLPLFGLEPFGRSSGRTALGGTEAEACARRASSPRHARSGCSTSRSLARRRLGQAARHGDRASSRRRRHRRRREPHGAQDEIRARARARAGARRVSAAWRCSLPATSSLPGAKAAPSAPRSASISSSSPSRRSASAPTSICFRASRPACCGWRSCLPACSPPTASSTTTMRTARSTCWRPGLCRSPLVAAIKSLAHWLTTGIPLALLAPLLGLLLNLPMQAIPLLVLAMLAGTPAVSFVAAHRREPHAGLEAKRPPARAARAAALRAGADLRRGDRLRRHRRPGLALAALPHALRA